MRDRQPISIRHAVITGGSSGIGRAIACRLAHAGAHISIIARTPATLEAAKGEIEAARQHSNQKVLTLSADVAQREQAEQAIEGAIAQLGPPDWLITCAGMARPGYFQDIPLEVFEQTMAVNYFGALYCIRAALPAMSKSGSKRRHIHLVSSGAGLIGLYGYTPYCPSKFAVRGLAESLRGELKPIGIGVSVSYPPDTDTPQLAAETQTKPPETQQITATAKLWSPEDVAYEIVTGIQQQRFAITPGLEMSVLSRLHSPLAPLLNWYFDRVVTQTRAKAAGDDI